MIRALFLLGTLLTCAQVTGFAESPQVRASARVFATQFTIGDDIRVLVEIETPRDFTVEPPSEKSPLEPFELKKVETSPVVRGKNRLKRTFALTVTVFEKGPLTFPAVPVGYRTPDGRSGEVRTEPIAIEITGVGRRPTDKEDIRGIKDPAFFSGKWFWNSAAGILAFLLFIFLAVKITIRRLHRAPDDESLKPPHVRVRLELERLKDKGLSGAAAAREYAAELANILRRYTERRMGVEAMEKTTGELAESMKSRGFDRSLIDRMRVFLERADRVKFAKEEPVRADLEAAEQALLQIVNETTPAETPAKVKSK